MGLSASRPNGSPRTAASCAWRINDVGGLGQDDAIERLPARLVGIVDEQDAGNARRFDLRQRPVESMQVVRDKDGVHASIENRVEEAFGAQAAFGDDEVRIDIQLREYVTLPFGIADADGESNNVRDGGYCVVAGTIATSRSLFQRAFASCTA